MLGEPERRPAEAHPVAGAHREARVGPPIRWPGSRSSSPGPPAPGPARVPQLGVVPRHREVPSARCRKRGTPVAASLTALNPGPP